MMQQHLKYQPCKPAESDVKSGELIRLKDYAGDKFGPVSLEDAQGDMRTIQGLPVSAGIAVGRATVIHSPEDLRKVTSDSILICPQMSPVYTIVFGRVRGVVAETGGILTTAGAAARKYGLPAVTGVQDAGKTITDGDVICIDGADGSIRNLS